MRTAYPSRCFTRAAATVALIVEQAGVAHAQEQRSQLLVQNIAIAAISAGIGAGINRRGDEGLAGAVLRGVLKGAGGGALIFEGKNTARLIVTEHRLEYAWLGHLIASAGASVIENTSAGRPALSRLHMNTAFIRFEIETTSGSIRARVLPASLVATAYQVAKNDVDWGRSLRLGTLVFNATDSDEARGGALVNTIAHIPSDWEPELEPVLAHEFVHTLQYEDYAAVPYFGQRAVGRLLGRHASWVDRWIYPDFLEYGVLRVRYDLIEGRSGARYCSNSLEREAMILGGPSAACVQTIASLATPERSIIVTRCFRTLKVEGLYVRRYVTRAHAEADIADYIERWYDRQRRHSTLGHLCPVSLELRHAA